jgi:hypothetical protein
VRGGVGHFCVEAAQQFLRQMVGRMGWCVYYVYMDRRIDASLEKRNSAEHDMCLVAVAVAVVVVVVFMYAAHVHVYT